MSRRAGLVAALALALALTASPPAAAKAPFVATVSGPGIAGEVDLAGVLGDQIDSLLLPVSHGLADSATEPPPGDPGPGYVFTWYSVRDMPPEPALDRVVYHPDAQGGPAIEVVSVSELFVPAHARGWHRVDPGRAAALDAAVAVASDGAAGAARYEFAGVEHAEATGEWWVPVGRSRAADDPAASRDARGLGWSRPVGVAAVLVAALVVLGAITARRRLRARQAGRRPVSPTAA